MWPSRPGALPQEARDRILLATVAAHLERSERLIAEFANAPGTVDLSAESAWARDLLAANRLYRQSVRQAGRQRLAVVLDDLEPFLLDLAHAEAAPPAEEIAATQERIASQALLFKVRVASDRLDPRKTDSLGETLCCGKRERPFSTCGWAPCPSCPV